MWKKNAILALLVHPNGLRFENIYVYSKSLNQPKYEFLKNLLEPIDGIQYFPYCDHEDVMMPDKLLPDSVMIFDDIACEKQDNVKAFFCMGYINRLIVSTCVNHLLEYQNIKYVII